MKIQRLIKEKIIKNIRETNKISIIYGPRQVGKTTLSKEIINDLKLKTLSINADQSKYIDILSSRDFAKMSSLVAGYELLFIDEAQRVPNIGINLKILHDEMPDLKIIATGSSSFDLANKISEPLTGRVWSYNLFPLAFCELKNIYSDFELKELLESSLIYGAYPEIFLAKNFQSKAEQLYEISRSYLYKDILDLQDIRKSGKINDLLKLLAFQVGSEVSLNELADKLDISRETVERYIDLLEKTFIIFRLKGFSRNLRKEVTKMNKIFFYDLGIRNAVIDNFKPLQDRDDVGVLWENFLIIERMKLLSYSRIESAHYFWRTHTGAELDYIEEIGGKLLAYEIKWGKKSPSVSNSWLETYPDSEYKVINRDNFLEFVTL
jgi:predicted AAA+ superfamily ATPase